MANLKEIKNRIVSVKNTQQITKAMNMVSASKLRRAHQHLEDSREYMKKIEFIIKQLVPYANDSTDEIPLMVPRAGKNNAAILLITSDKGLCGALNNNLNKSVQNFCTQNKDKFSDFHFYCFGKKGRDYFKRRGYTIKEEYVDTKESLKIASIDGLMDKLIERYLRNEITELHVAYTHFESVITHHSMMKRALPFKMEEDNFEPMEFLFEPSEKEVLNELLLKYIKNLVYVSLLESVTSEHGARMSAMDSATRNAGEMISKLSLTYNRARQAAITTELIEIISGAESVQ